VRWAAATLLLLQLALPAHAGSRVTYYINDALGSPAATLDETGAVIARADYLPYGGSTDTTGNVPTNAIDRIGYTGHVQDDTGLVYVGARYFDPVAGRFMGMDPVGFDEANPQSFNRYQYANNNPYRFVDPDGGSPEIIWDAFNVGLGVSSLASNLSSGNYVAAAADTIGIVVDVLATIAPAVPGGVGAGIKAYRDGGKSATRTPNEAGVIREYITEVDQIYYRIFSDGNSVGKYLTAVKPKSSAYALEALALPRANRADSIQEVVVPAGTKLRRSRAAPIRADKVFPDRRGGAEQFELLDRIPTRNFGPAEPLR
jgi:RHS repeat-associated protein